MRVVNIRVRSRIALLLLVPLCSCAARRPTSPLPDRFEPNADYVDLKPGWRLRVITPILKSGGYRLKSVEEATAESGQLSAGPDFIGYEVSVYMLRKREAGIRVSFDSAVRVEYGKPKRVSQPLVSLFESFPEELCCIRILHTLRVSDADHDAAIIGAPSREALSTLTERVQNDPSHNCLVQHPTVCFWIPKGIAVQPEMRRSRNGQWVPAR